MIGHTFAKYLLFSQSINIFIRNTVQREK